MWVTRRPSDLYTITSFSSHDFTFSMLHHTFHCKFANKGEKLSWSFDLQRRSHRFQECLGRKGEANGRDSKCHSYIYIYIHNHIIICIYKTLYNQELCSDINVKYACDFRVASVTGRFRKQLLPLTLPIWYPVIQFHLNIGLQQTNIPG